MSDETERAFVREILERNRYLVLSTTDGRTPWIAPLEYMVDEDLNFYFFSTGDSRHVRDLEKNETVAVTVFDREQPEYTPDLSARLNGVQMEAVAHRVDPDDYSEAIVAAIDALDPPMPPYEVFKVTPRRFYVPKIENGVNIRMEAR
ncbi:MAG: pyridoxamine 5'-phosphate oxidase family protein [Longimicrobiales bacterium]|nr:pyridoxamine 5'-phosphate oxidase family protein [Longimicrobiales bacterium]